MNYQEINKRNIFKWEDTLKYLVTVLHSNSIPYYLSASGLDYVLGKEIYPYDIDLFMSSEDVKRAFELLKEHTISDIHKWENKYIEFQGIYNDIPFEVCEWEIEPKEFKVLEFKGIRVDYIHPSSIMLE